MKDICPLNSMTQNPSGLMAPGKRARSTASRRSPFQLPFAGSPLTPLDPPCRADRDCSQHSGHGCTPALCRRMLYCMVAADARSNMGMPSVYRVLQRVPRHTAVRPTALLWQAGGGQDICQHKGRGFKERSHKAVQRARLFLNKTRYVATGWDMAGVVLQPTSCGG